MAIFTNFEDYILQALDHFIDVPNNFIKIGFAIFGNGFGFFALNVRPLNGMQHFGKAN